MTSRPQKAGGGMECAVFVVAFGLVAEVLLRAIPIVAGATANAIGTLRLAIYLLACVGLGFWLHRRYSLSIPRAALAMGAGVAVTFVLRATRDYLDGFHRGEEPQFLIGLAVMNWIVLLAGAALGHLTHSRRGLPEDSN